MFIYLREYTEGCGFCFSKGYPKQGMSSLSEVHSGMWEGTKGRPRATCTVTPPGGSSVCPFLHHCGVDFLLRGGGLGMR